LAWCFRIMRWSRCVLSCQHEQPAARRAWGFESTSVFSASWKDASPRVDGLANWDRLLADRASCVRESHFTVRLDTVRLATAGLSDAVVKSRLVVSIPCLQAEARRVDDRGIRQEFFMPAWRCICMVGASIHDSHASRWVLSCTRQRRGLLSPKANFTHRRNSLDLHRRSNVAFQNSANATVLTPTRITSAWPLQQAATTLQAVAIPILLQLPG
jgi:hypothetical protein